MRTSLKMASWTFGLFNQKLWLMTLFVIATLIFFSALQKLCTKICQFQWSSSSFSLGTTCCSLHWLWRWWVCYNQTPGFVSVVEVKCISHTHTLFSLALLKCSSTTMCGCLGAWWATDRCVCLRVCEKQHVLLVAIRSREDGKKRE